jgi:purine-nucleoside phosphorylase
MMRIMTNPDAPMPSAFSDHEDTVSQGLAAVREITTFEPDVAIILGSGLGPLADEIEAEAVIPYGELPGFAQSSAPGHAGRLVLGHLSGKRVVAMQGRVHYYEGISAKQAAFPVRVMHALGARTLLVSNACGGINPNWQAGDLMLQLDFINFTWANPLIGPNDEAQGPRFPVMFDCYDAELNELARQTARAQDILLREGVYLAVSGPSYATRAELRAFRAWGADAIGMSTVHEVITARHQGMRVLGLSSVTDMAIADRHEHATGDDVLASAAQSGLTFRKLVKAILERM